MGNMHKTLVKFIHVVFELSTDRQTYLSQYVTPLPRAKYLNMLKLIEKKQHITASFMEYAKAMKAKAWIKLLVIHNQHQLKSNHM